MFSLRYLLTSNHRAVNSSNILVSLVAILSILTSGFLVYWIRGFDNQLTLKILTKTREVVEKNINYQAVDSKVATEKITKINLLNFKNKVDRFFSFRNNHKNQSLEQLKKLEIELFEQIFNFNKTDNLVIEDFSPIERYYQIIKNLVRESRLMILIGLISLLALSISWKFYSFFKNRKKIIKNQNISLRLSFRELLRPLREDTSSNNDFLSYRDQIEFNFFKNQLEPLEIFIILLPLLENKRSMILPILFHKSSYPERPLFYEIDSIIRNIDNNYQKSYQDRNKSQSDFKDKLERDIKTLVDLHPEIKKGLVIFKITSIVNSQRANIVIDLYKLLDLKSQEETVNPIFLDLARQTTEGLSLWLSTGLYSNIGHQRINLVDVTNCQTWPTSEDIRESTSTSTDPRGNPFEPLAELKLKRALRLFTKIFKGLIEVLFLKDFLTCSRAGSVSHSGLKFKFNLKTNAKDPNSQLSLFNDLNLLVGCYLESLTLDPLQKGSAILFAKKIDIKEFVNKESSSSYYNYRLTPYLQRNQFKINLIEIDSTGCNSFFTNKLLLAQRNCNSDLLSFTIVFNPSGF